MKSIWRRFFSQSTLYCLLVLFLVVLFFLIFFLLIEIGYAEKTFDSLLREEVVHSLDDECSVFVGNIAHTIGDESVCQNRCEIYCEAVHREFSRTDFLENPGECNSCKCSCR